MTLFAHLTGSPKVGAANLADSSKKSFILRGGGTSKSSMLAIFDENNIDLSPHFRCLKLSLNCFVVFFLLISILTNAYHYFINEFKSKV